MTTRKDGRTENKKYVHLRWKIEIGLVACADNHKDIAGELCRSHDYAA